MAQKFIDFINQTGSPYHTVEAAKHLLKEAGFLHLKESNIWNIARGGRYYVTRNNSAICAFVVGKAFAVDKGGFAMVAGHTDSPCLRLRPNSNMKHSGFLQLGVETYGGGIWHTWFDRGLGMAGKVVYKHNNEVKETLIRIAKPVCIIPSLAIHLSTDRKNFSINEETHLRPVLGSVATLLNDKTQSENCRFSAPIISLLAKEIGCENADIIDVDICLFDSNPAQFSGLQEEFIESGRIDNVASTWAAVQGLVDAVDSVGDKDIAVALAFDHEECGSGSWTGADSSCLHTWLERILTGLGEDVKHFPVVLGRSLLVSADMAHALHPNYSEKHQNEHRPEMNKGIVIKMNGNQRYATHALTAMYVREVAGKVSPAVAVQDFCVRNDSPCGSTIGPILSSKLGVRTVDIGCPQWAMHSIRETCGRVDMDNYARFTRVFFEKFGEVDSSVITLDAQE